MGNCLPCTVLLSEVGPAFRALIPKDTQTLDIEVQLKLRLMKQRQVMPNESNMNKTLHLWLSWKVTLKFVKSYYVVHLNINLLFILSLVFICFIGWTFWLDLLLSDLTLLKFLVYLAQFFKQCSNSGTNMIFHPFHYNQSHPSG